ncbi:ornithine carbamoyltransferase [Virgibacillus profundi]|uniref:Ornithine carbamoyltransferase n=1 Tax=Virgibacillus profundi TaxID=2024555 RepID=A0A2A2IIJ6_9BACI|nr:ornithine carbamoyltransferase [Virgibacillus profundi]PAV31619.1 ornithine carbamoyltransferase [Virgibacillus profundi]PXY55805.1 ornithine carbamoyltransferase [Virgibacillus profundi]
MELKADDINPEPNLSGRDFLTLADYGEEELLYILETAHELKAKQKSGVLYQPLKGKTLGIIFEKASTRTRVSFETGIYQLGGMGLFLSSDDIQMGRGEPIPDTAKVLSGYLDGIMIRTFSQETVEELAENASIPVINGLTDLYHPCQVLADFQTIQEVKGNLKNVKLAYIGDGNNVAHSLMLGAAIIGMDISIATPAEYQPDYEVIQKAKTIAAKKGSKVEVTEDPVRAVRNADALYTDVWASMGQEQEQKIREQQFAEFQVNEELFSHAAKDAIFMHCLPAHRGEEVSAEVIDGKQSVVFQQAENRLHAQKALMVALMA